MTVRTRVFTRTCTDPTGAPIYATRGVGATLAPFARKSRFLTLFVPTEGVTTMRTKVQPPAPPKPPTRRQLLDRAAQLSSRRAGLVAKINELLASGDPTDPEDYTEHLALTSDRNRLDQEVAELVRQADLDPEWRRSQTDALAASTARKAVPVVVARASAAVLAAVEQVKQVRLAVAEAERLETRLSNATAESVTARTSEQLAAYLSDPAAAALDAVATP